ncbi:hypothetical protein N7519_002159 [Penicillium mononematosum]|uniref:uncharacterized protein n=1 Tax=Penicillium mononematosum TaxID=268346 RepID=UPI0025476B92|nr:uncharacterized protein N7519_002159 [Penicillium mononematosum]KAJ6187251.1 hypothetical protein N7519_002159 [Penicillium mononematosum]
MAKQFYTLGEVLAVARNHPFYNRDVKYPLSPNEVLSVTSEAQSSDDEFQQYPIIDKKNIFSVIETLAADDSPENTFRQSSYTSVTGGGWSRGVPMLFLTDSAENRRQRESIGALIEAVGIVQPKDWILNIHVSGYLYRSLDLLTDALEYAGGTILCAGGDMSAELATKTLIQYRCNFLTGPVTELIKLSRHISGLPSDIRSQVRITKILYTSEPLLQSQRSLLMEIFNSPAIYSGLGSAEAGFWAVSNPQLTDHTEDVDTADDGADFVYDIRAMHVEILTRSSPESNSPLNQPVADGNPGAIVLTSLQRLRNPLVRYNSGDIGSLHPLPAKAQTQIAPERVPYLRLLRIYGRDKQFSFNWGSNYFHYDTIHKMMQTEEFGILQWQILLGWEQDVQGVESMEVRILRESSSTKDSILPEDELVAQIKFSFLVITNPYFRVVIVNDVNDFERSGTGRKVTRVVDRR